MFKKIMSTVVFAILVSSLLASNIFASGENSIENGDDISFRESFGFETNENHLLEVDRHYDRDFYDEYGIKLLPKEVEDFKITDEIANNHASKIEESLENSSLSDVYAGLFIDQKTGKLNLAFTREVSINSTEINDVLEDFPHKDKVDVIEVNHKKEELDKISDEIFKNRDNYSEQYGFDILGSLSLFMEGKINIQVSTNNNATVVKETLEKYYDVPIKVEKVSELGFNDQINVEEASEHDLEIQNATVRPGTGMTACTAGFPATAGGSYFMFTAAHCSPSTFYLLNGGALIGHRSSVFDKNGGSVDAVGILVNQSQLSSNLVYSSGSLSGYQRTSSEVIGQSVWLQGSRSGNANFGTLQSTNYSFIDNENNIIFTNFRASNYSRTGGDSGGTIHNTSQLMGIHKGHYGGYSVYTHVTNIISDMGITPYFP